MENREPELRPKTVTSYRWMLSGHLLPHFARTRLDRISPEDVDRYKAAKLREGGLGPNQINKSIGLLAMILDAAGDYGHTDPARDPARGRRRRVKRTPPKRPTIEPEQLPSLLEAARKLRPIVATMAGVGLRNGEACGLDWRDFDPASGTLRVAASKDGRGAAECRLPQALRRELTALKLRTRHSSEGPMFRNRNGSAKASATSSGVSRRRSGERTCARTSWASSRSMRWSLRTRRAASTQACASLWATIPCTWRPSWAH